MGWDKKEWSFWLAVMVAIVVVSMIAGKRQAQLELVPLDGGWTPR